MSDIFPFVNKIRGELKLIRIYPGDPRFHELNKSEIEFIRVRAFLIAALATTDENEGDVQDPVFESGPDSLYADDEFLQRFLQKKLGVIEYEKSDQ